MENQKNNISEFEISVMHIYKNHCVLLQIQSLK